MAKPRSQTKEKSHHSKSTSSKAKDKGQTKSEPKTSQSNKGSRRSLLQRLRFRWGKKQLLLLLLISLILWAGYDVVKDLPSPRKLSTDQYQASTLIQDRHGRTIYEIYADQNRIPIKLSDLPEYVIQATIAIEDKDFYQHKGLDFSGLARAMWVDIRYLGCQTPLVKQLIRPVLGCGVTLQGGSTITQQLIKNSLLTPERTLNRKLKEIILTVLVEALYDKDQILEMYLNQIPYGGTAYGIEAASRTYFAKPASQLSLAEAAVLAGLPVAPSKYSPFGSDPQLYRQRQQLVLEKMRQLGYITPEQEKQALDQEITFVPPRNLRQAPHFALWIKQILTEKYGLKTVETGGLRVRTSLDLNLQTSAAASLSAQLKNMQTYNISNAAAMITNPTTGEVLAMIGSADYFDPKIDGNVNIALTYQQPGSSIKPLNYTLAFENNLLSPATILADLPTCFYVAGVPRPYCPKNFDNSYHGPTSARFALANSYNIPAVRVLALNGIENFITTANQLGITNWQDPSQYGLSLTLGGGEVRTVDMAVAYSALANFGWKVPLHPILEITDYQSNLWEKLDCQLPEPDKLLGQVEDQILPADCQAQRVFSPQATYLTYHILTDQNARRPTFGNLLNIAGHPDVAVKTGTTNQLRDNWTIGYTPNRLTLVWVGNNDNTPIKRLILGRVGAAPIWKSLMTQAVAGQPVYHLNPPEDIIGTQICSWSGQLPVEGCPTTFDLFQRSRLPQEALPITRPWPIDKTTQSLAQPDTPPEQIEMQDRQIVFDALGQPVCLNCPYQAQKLKVNYPLVSQTQDSE